MDALLSLFSYVKSLFQLQIMEDLQKAVFERILASQDAFYKHQQVGEEELTIAERKDILKDCFENKKPIFIQR